jgi:hypothetical protein
MEANTRTARVRLAERALDRSQKALREYRDSDDVLTALGAAEFAEGLQLRRERVRIARLDVAARRDELGIHALPAVHELEARWPSMTVAERRALLGQVIDCAFVSRGVRDEHKRVIVCPKGTAPRNLPHSGDKHTLIRTYEPRKRWIYAATLLGR